MFFLVFLMSRVCRELHHLQFRILSVLLFLQTLLIREPEDDFPVTHTSDASFRISHPQPPGQDAGATPQDVHSDCVLQSAAARKLVNG